MKCLLVVMMAGALLMGGCDDDAATAPKPTVDGFALMGLTNGHQLMYMQSDTVTTFYPEYSQTVSSQTRQVSVAGTGTDWVVRENGQAVVNIKLSSPYVLQNGVWKHTEAGDSLFYYAEPPVVMHQRFDRTTVWDGFTPFYPAAGSVTRYPFFNIYFGFYYERRYAGVHELLVPSGAYSTHRFDVELFFSQPTATDSLPDAIASEYYAPNVGLVKLAFAGQGLKRTLSLLATE